MIACCIDACQAIYDTLVSYVRGAGTLVGHLHKVLHHFGLFLCPCARGVGGRRERAEVRTKQVNGHCGLLSACLLDGKSISCAAHEIEFVCEYNYPKTSFFLCMFVRVAPQLTTVLFTRVCVCVFGPECVVAAIFFVLKLNYSV